MNNTKLNSLVELGFFTQTNYNYLETNKRLLVCLIDFNSDYWLKATESVGIMALVYNINCDLKKVIIENAIEKSVQFLEAEMDEIHDVLYDEETNKIKILFLETLEG